MKKILITFFLLIASISLLFGKVKVYEKSGIYYSNISKNVIFIVNKSDKVCYVINKKTYMPIKCDKLKKRIEWKNIITW